MEIIFIIRSTFIPLKHLFVSHMYTTCSNGFRRTKLLPHDFAFFLIIKNGNLLEKGFKTSLNFYLNHYCEVRFSHDWSFLDLGENRSFYVFLFFSSVLSELSLYFAWVFRCFSYYFKTFKLLKMLDQSFFYLFQEMNYIRMVWP